MTTHVHGIPANFTDTSICDCGQRFLHLGFRSFVAVDNPPQFFQAGLTLDGITELNKEGDPIPIGRKAG